MKKFLSKLLLVAAVGIISATPPDYSAQRQFRSDDTSTWAERYLATYLRTEIKTVKNSAGKRD